MREHATGDPLLTVIVPVRDGAAHLRRSLPALAASTLPRAQWELIVVDDGSRDDGVTVAAQWADRVIDGDATVPTGPAAARNRGAAVARGRWLVFVDADVAVHRDALVRLAAHAHDDVIDAVFGRYDDAPSAPGAVSRARNLAHAIQHERAAGVATTFWAGLGMVRAAAFEAVGGFDAARFRRPAIEDVELGYRLARNGHVIRLDPAIRGTHRKAWRFWHGVRTDLRDRGIPWMHLLLEGAQPAGPARLAVRQRDRLGVACAALACSAVALMPWAPRTGALVALALLTAMVAIDASLLRALAERGGVAVLFAGVAVRAVSHVTNLVSVVAGAVAWLRRGAPRLPRGARDDTARDDASREHAIRDHATRARGEARWLATPRHAGG